ncbi:proton channel OtopLc-like isoform X3 [Schistocerca gregaria]|uniref:proton channel OtopLc-like isoform X3 n=1 Tax=Schistocerca gregaria TaxID=7010 RepID=UPI00211E2C5B|nr:proton channel OtopLc-like isoform X3 [Schistocerca gregaria]
MWSRNSCDLPTITVRCPCPLWRGVHVVRLEGRCVQAWPWSPSLHCLWRRVTVLKILGRGWPGGATCAVGVPEAPQLPSPASQSAVLVSAESLSQSQSSASRQLTALNRSLSSGAASPTHQAPAIPVKNSSPSGLPSPTTMMSPVLYSTAALKRPSRIDQLQGEWRQMGTDALTTTLSALYGKLLVVMGIAFPMAEVISTYIPPSFYEGFYLYLYFGSMVFLIYMYAMLLRERASQSVASSFKRTQTQSSVSVDSGSEESGDTRQHTDTELSTAAGSQGRGRSATPLRQQAAHLPQHHYGSFYLRMGAVAFGIGSMIYSGLEFGQYFELERNTKCHNVLLALTPATRMAFIFIQMYFIFLNNEDSLLQQMKVYKHRALARFGLMHMIGTNLSVWLNVLIQETKHEILTFYSPENKTLGIQHRLLKLAAATSGGTVLSGQGPEAAAAAAAHHRVARGLKGPHHIYECRRTNIMGSLVQDASPFLFPCTIEYSLICAAILYVMWKNISRLQISCGAGGGGARAGQPAGAGLAQQAYKRPPHHYSVDCARAHKGLFVGILVLVLTIISLILFFVLISKPELVGLAVMEVNICELTLYTTTTVATLVGMVQVRQLKYDGCRNLELDNILLVGAQTGMFIYSTFTIIGGHFTIEKNTVLVLITALASLVQTTCQTMFVLDASRRSCATPDQIRRKPGRELVTFLLVTNLAMWAINTLEKSRAESHPIQLHFYGLWAWTIITHVSMPLAIFYRFHSTVCLCEIWKRAYKMKPTYM